MNDESGEDLSSWWHAAAASVSRFNKQCHLEEKRQETRGIRSLCEAVAQHIKLKCDGDRIEASTVLRFLQQQIAVLMNKEKHAKQAVSRAAAMCDSDSGDTTRPFQAVAASLAQMYTHVRQQSVSRPATAARGVAQELVKFFSVYDGQMVDKAALLDLLQRYLEQQQMPGPAEELSASVSPSHRTREDPVPRKRSHDIVDPAFEQAFKRQCQPPPTPPASKLPAQQLIDSANCALNRCRLDDSNSDI